MFRPILIVACILSSFLCTQLSGRSKSVAQIQPPHQIYTPCPLPPPPPQPLPPLPQPLPPKPQPKPYSATEALDEVNALRARRGLRPYICDDGLTQGAMACASYRAQHLMAGHTRNDFGFLPQGTHATAAGCAAWPPSQGWGSCAIYERHTYGGAAWAMGRDGKRYMHLFVR